MKINGLRDLSYQFALKIVQLHENNCVENNYHNLHDKLLEVGTALGEKVAEADSVKQNSDALFYLKDALNSSIKAKYWLQLLRDSKLIDRMCFNSLYDDLLKINKEINNKLSLEAS